MFVFSYLISLVAPHETTKFTINLVQINKSWIGINHSMLKFYFLTDCEVSSALKIR